ncbi:MAG: hypothetical protein A2V85_10225 [Chloroflexi bacterium RBG_16_72_14]|nr:MAG: hypothetical protein A2V85_10225 [Chloroflexi bacterium RBG_16_72_14]
MLRLLHTADVHLGARHADLGDAASAQRERQFAAFRTSVDLAIAEKVDLFLVAGDLFDSNVQPRRSVERVAAELARLAQARIRSVLIPGTHDVYDRSSVYRAYDLPALAGTRPAEEMVTILAPERPWIHLPSLDVVVHGPVFATKRAPHSPLRDLAAAETPAATWRIGLLHASISIPGRTEHDEVVVTLDEIGASGLDYLALGHWHSAQSSKAKGVAYAYSGAPEPVAVDQDRAGKVLLVTLEERDGAKAVAIDERVVGELARLAQARIRSVLIPGTHDVYDRSSVYRAYDLPALAGTRPAEEMVTILAPERPWIHLPSLDVVVHGPVFATKRAPHSPLRDLAAAETPAATWRIGLLHASISIPGRTEHDEVVVTLDEIGASGLDYLALGHWHSAQSSKAKGVAYAYSGAPEPVAVDQDRAGKVLLVTLEERDGAKAVAIDERVVGRTSFVSLDVDAATVASQPALIDMLRATADPDQVLDVRLIGVRPDTLDLEPLEVEQTLKAAYLRVRVRDASRPALTEGALPPAETIAGAFIRSVEGRIADLEASGDDPAQREAVELRDALRLGRLLLAGQEVTL